MVGVIQARNRLLHHAVSWSERFECCSIPISALSGLIKALETTYVWFQSLVLLVRDQVAVQPPL
jgi:hypothetical protein